MNDSQNFDANWSVEQIQHGWDVFDVNGDKVGDVHDVNRSYLTVSKGFLFPSERYIPVRDIQGIRHDRVYLGVSKNQLEQEGWDQVPAESMDTMETTGTTTTRNASYATDATDERYATDATAGDLGTEGARRIELREEELVPHTEQVQTGEVNLHKDVVTEQQSVEVPVTREEVIVERRPVEGRPASGTIGQEQDITVPVHEEQVTLDKQAQVYEEADVRTREVQDTQQVSGTVRKEVLDVDKEGNVDVDREGRQGQGLTDREHRGPRT
jgi:uncharacterized protein (TIGR02271 family)